MAEVYKGFTITPEGRYYVGRAAGTALVSPTLPGARALIDDAERVLAAWDDAIPPAPEPPPERKVPGFVKLALAGGIWVVFWFGVALLPRLVQQ
jgi:hypothetical protein